jgi:hypothetical protein
MHLRDLHRQDWADQIRSQRVRVFGGDTVATRPEKKKAAPKGGF